MTEAVSTAADQAQADALEAVLRQTGNPTRAASERRYLKSDIEFIGVGVPGVRAAVRDFLREQGPMERETALGLVTALWARPVHERRVAAIALLQHHQRLLEPDDIGLLERLIRESLTWAYVDALAVDVAGRLVERYPELNSVLDRWARDEDFWVRRASMLALLRPIRRGEGDFERFGRYADSMLEEREFFIRKAIGWVLREASKRRPELVYAWLKPRVTRASGVTVREAVKYLPTAQREELMAAYRPRGR
jgi:3-methyladenine DNA glycosylase AlkD